MRVMKGLEDLFFDVSMVYTLVDEGYVEPENNTVTGDFDPNDMVELEGMTTKEVNEMIERVRKVASSY